MEGIRIRARASRPLFTIEDYRARALRRLPAIATAYIESGADAGSTLRSNTTAFDAWTLRQRVLVGGAPAGLAVSVAGQELALPLMIAPTGLSGLCHPRGDLALAEGAERIGTRLVLSSAGSYTPEEVAAAAGVHHFFQLYAWRGSDRDARALTSSLIRRAKDAGFAALMLTVDTPTYGNRVTERHAGMGLPIELTPSRILDIARRPSWWAGVLRHRRVGLRTLRDAPGIRGALFSAELFRELLHPELGWDDLAWIRDNWGGPLLIKGILDPEDADRAVRLGADGIVVSNHGGRQLDGVTAALEALPAIVDRVGTRAEVLMDGGIRRGSDIVKALALGARAVMVGRPALYGLAAGGADGVAGALEILRSEVGRTLTLMGVPSLDVLDRSWISRSGPTA